MVLDDFEPVCSFLHFFETTWNCTDQFKIHCTGNGFIWFWTSFVISVFFWNTMQLHRSVQNTLYGQWFWMLLNRFCHFCIFLKHNEITPISSKYIVWAMVFDGFEPVSTFLHFWKQHEIALIVLKCIVRAMVLDGFEPVLSFLHFSNTQWNYTDQFKIH